MTPEEIIEGNMVIVESPFISDVHKSWLRELKSKGRELRFYESAQYHKSWDWLMPVCRKFASIEIHIQADDLKQRKKIYSEYVDRLKSLQNVVSSLPETPMPVFEQLVSNLKWYASTPSGGKTKE